MPKSDTVQADIITLLRKQHGEVTATDILDFRSKLGNKHATPKTVLDALRTLKKRNVVAIKRYQGGTRVTLRAA